MSVSPAILVAQSTSIPEGFMAHQSLYRTYRPQTFDDVVGQTHITRTLKNAVAEGTVAHAYLFTGPRGTGKTTTARILAKALNCQDGPTPDPDVEGEQCIEIAEGRHPDVHELDAASRTGVDNVREEIIGRLAYAPTRGRYKVYIIDEVHMLSTGAFNALLKSIEEPPPHTVFIMCTTHPHKVPDTILSRCQRFDFHRIGIDDIVGRLVHICGREEIKVEEGALALVAKHAMGGLRDAISTLEQLSVFTGKDIKLVDVEDLLGEVDTELLFEVADVIARRDVAAGFVFVARLADTGIDMTEFVRDLTGHMRDLYVIAAVGDASGIVDASTNHLSRLTSQAALFGIDRLSRVLDILAELGAEIRWSSDPRLSIEVALTRMARPHGDLSLEALAARVEELEQALAAGAGVTAVPAAVTADENPDEDAEQAEDSSWSEVGDTPTPPLAEQKTEEIASESEPAPEKTETAAADSRPAADTGAADSGLDRATVKRSWVAVVAEFRKRKPSRAMFFSNVEVDVDSADGSIVIEFPEDMRHTMSQAKDPATREILGQSLASVFGTVPSFRYQLGRGAVRSADDSGDEPQTIAELEAETEILGTEEATDDAEAPAPAASEDDDDDVEALLLAELGAEKIAEHPHETDEQ